MNFHITSIFSVFYIWREKGSNIIFTELNECTMEVHQYIFVKSTIIYNTLAKKNTNVNFFEANAIILGLFKFVSFRTSLNYKYGIKVYTENTRQVEY